MAPDKAKSNDDEVNDLPEITVEDGDAPVVLNLADPWANFPRETKEGYPVFRWPATTDLGVRVALGGGKALRRAIEGAAVRRSTTGSMRARFSRVGKKTETRWTVEVLE